MAGAVYEIDIPGWAYVLTGAAILLALAAAAVIVGVAYRRERRSNAAPANRRRAQ